MFPFSLSSVLNLLGKKQYLDNKSNILSLYILMWIELWYMPFENYNTDDNNYFYVLCSL